MDAGQSGGPRFQVKSYNLRRFEMIAALSKTKKHRQTLNIGNQWLNGRDKGRGTKLLILNLLSP